MSSSTKARKEFADHGGLSMFIVFRCACGQQLQVNEEFAGKTSTCSHCGAHNVVPASSEDTVTPKDSPPGATDPYLPPVQPRAPALPARPLAQSSGVWLVVALATVVLLGGFATWFFVLRKPIVPSPELPSSPAAVDDLALIPDDAVGFVTIQLGEWWSTEHAQKLLQQMAPLGPLDLLESALGVPPDLVQRATLIILSPEQFCFVISTRKPVQPSDVTRILVPEGKPIEHEGKSYLVENDLTLHFAEGNRQFFFGNRPAVQAVTTRTHEANRDSPLDTARKQAADHLLVIGVNPEAPASRDLRQHLSESFRQLVPALTQAKTIALSGDLSDELRLQLSLTLPTESTAQQAEREFRGLLGVARPSLVELKNWVQREKRRDPLRPIVDPVTLLVESMLGTVQIQQVDSRLNVVMRTEKDLLATQMIALVDGAQKAKELNILRQLGVAMHNYEATNRAFPTAAICGATGNPLLSWRVAILPYLGHEALYQQFHLQEPWDSDHNRKLLPKMPMQFASPRVGDAPHTTHYRVFTGPNALFPATHPAGRPNRGMRIVQVSDGASNTLMVVEASDAVPWTKPDELPYDPQKPLPKLGTRSDGFHATYVDGAVRFFKNLDEMIIRALITPRGGEIIPLLD